VSAERSRNSTESFTSPGTTLGAFGNTWKRPTVPTWRPGVRVVISRTASTSLEQPAGVDARFGARRRSSRWLKYRPCQQSACQIRDEASSVAVEGHSRAPAAGTGIIPGQVTSWLDSRCREGFVGMAGCRTSLGGTPSP
jgi:hypothetical protein